MDFLHRPHSWKWRSWISLNFSSKDSVIASIKLKPAAFESFSPSLLSVQFDEVDWTSVVWYLWIQELLVSAKLVCVCQINVHKSFEKNDKWKDFLYFLIVNSSHENTKTQKWNDPSNKSCLCSWRIMYRQSSLFLELNIVQKY